MKILNNFNCVLFDAKVIWINTMFTRDKYVHSTSAVISLNPPNKFIFCEKYNLFVVKFNLKQNNSNLIKRIQKITLVNWRANGGNMGTVLVIQWVVAFMIFVFFFSQNLNKVINKQTKFCNVFFSFLFSKLMIGYFRIVEHILSQKLYPKLQNMHTSYKSFL